MLGVQARPHRLAGQSALPVAHANDRKKRDVDSYNCNFRVAPGFF
jgi:hypothetical protein